MGKLRRTNYSRTRPNPLLIISLCIILTFLVVMLIVLVFNKLQDNKDHNNLNNNLNNNSSVIISSSSSQASSNPSSEIISSSSSEVESSSKPTGKPTDFKNAVSQSEPVDLDYFNDAAFIGDSRVEGFMLYNNMSMAKNFTHKGLSIDKITTKRYAKDKSGNGITIIDAVKDPSIKKIYIKMGLNELGWPYDSVFKSRYGEVIDSIKKNNPSATIYIQSILPVSKKKSDNDKIFNNTNVNRFNKIISELAQEKEIYFLDVGAAFKDANGYLPEEASTDGIHLNKQYCEKWLEYLKAHTVK